MIDKLIFYDALQKLDDVCQTRRVLRRLTHPNIGRRSKNQSKIIRLTEIMLGIVLYEYAIFDNVSSKFPKNTKKILTHYRFANLLAKLDRRFEIYKNFSANPRQDKTSHLNSTNIGNKQLRQKLVQKKKSNAKRLPAKKTKACGNAALFPTNSQIADNRTRNKMSTTAAT